MVEVLISGAGPAGAVAAFVLARRGVRVLLVDRARFPRDKLCGDTLNPGAIAHLRSLGLAGPVESRGIALTGIRVTGPGADVPADYPGGVTGLAIARRDLDLLLVEAAAAAGAQLRDATRVVAPLLDEAGPVTVVRGAVLEVDGRRVRVPAMVTIAADGRRSTLGTAVGLTSTPVSPRRWAVGATFSGVSAMTSRGEMHIRPGHYVGLAPLPGGLTSVCLVGTAASGGWPDPGQALAGAVETDRRLRDRFRAATRVSDVRTLGPLATDSQAAGVSGLLLAGDAAGFVDPLTGDGVRLAMRGGMLAADVALAMLEQPSLKGHLRLAALRAAEFDRKLRVNRALRRVVGSPACVRAGVVLARLAPVVLRRLTEFAGDVGVATGGGSREVSVA
jgi:flavin-dependent dehydrogenase